MSPLSPTLCRWVFVYEKGYQSSSGLISSVSVKLKGLAVTQFPGLGRQIWDVADYVFPAQVSWLRGTLPTHRAWLRAGLGSVSHLLMGPVQLLSLSLSLSFPTCE